MSVHNNITTCRHVTSSNKFDHDLTNLMAAPHELAHGLCKLSHHAHEARIPCGYPGTHPRKHSAARNRSPAPIASPLPLLLRRAFSEFGLQKIIRAARRSGAPPGPTCHGPRMLRQRHPRHERATPAPRWPRARLSATASAVTRVDLISRSGNFRRNHNQVPGLAIKPLQSF